jgi:hypothetical protein
MLTVAEQRMLTEARTELRLVLNKLDDLMPDNDSPIEFGDLTAMLLLVAMGDMVRNYLNLVNDLKDAMLTSDPRDERA